MHNIVYGMQHALDYSTNLFYFYMQQGLKQDTLETT